MLHACLPLYAARSCTVHAQICRHPSASCLECAASIVAIVREDLREFSSRQLQDLLQDPPVAQLSNAWTLTNARPFSQCVDQAVCLQAAPVVGRASWVLRLFLQNWEKLLIAAILIALIVLVSVKVSRLPCGLLHFSRALQAE